MTTSAVCRDLDPLNCAEYGVIGCSDPVTSNFMKNNCRFTCKICGEPESDGKMLLLFTVVSVHCRSVG